MLYIRNHLIFGAIRSFFTVLFTIAYKIVGVFRLQLFLFCVVTGALLEIAFGWISRSTTGFAVFHLALCLSVAYAVIAGIFRILHPFGNSKRRRGAAQILNTEEAPQEKALGKSVAQTEPEVREREAVREPERPKYYRVRKNPAYIMAEYGDRVELYKEENGTLIYVRTDYKKR